MPNFVKDCQESVPRYSPIGRKEDPFVHAASQQYRRVEGILGERKDIDIEQSQVD